MTNRCNKRAARVVDIQKEMHNVAIDDPSTVMHCDGCVLSRYGCFAKYLEHPVDERSTLQHSDNLIDFFEFSIVAADTYTE
jgi:hypothetical protein